MIPAPDASLSVATQRKARRDSAGKRRHLVAGSAAIPAFSAVGVLAVSAVLLAQLATPDLLDRAALPLAVVGIVLGIPHGAVDHMVPFWTASAPARPAMLGVLASYLGVAAAAAGALLLFPSITIVAFLVASAAHFGRAEVVFAAERAGRPTPNGRQEVLTVVAHGSAVVILPLALWHEQVVAVLGPLSPVFAKAMPVWALVAGASLTIAANAVAVAVGWQRGRVTEVAETALITVAFAVVPPIAIFGAYFGGWHALRHTGRLLALPGPEGSPLPLGPAARRYAGHAAVPTIVAVGGLLLVWRFASGSILSAAIAALLALTFPHMRTVACLDRWAAASTR